MPLNEIKGIRMGVSVRARAPNLQFFKNIYHFITKHENRAVILNYLV